MNPELLLAHFNRISDSPNAIPRLRSFILDLAVRGKLVEQDSKDEPASELLKQVLAEKNRLLKEGKIKKQSPLPPVESTVPFDLPSGWSWVRLGNLSQLVTSGSRDWAKFYSTDGAIFVRMGNLSRDSYQLRLDNIQRVTPPTDSEGARTRLEEGDILISITGEVGLLGLIPPNFGEAYINQHTCLVRSMERLRGLYLPELFRSRFAQSQFDEPQRGLKNSFRLTDVTQFLVPLPPLAEQRRIVTRVSELMAICNQLEAADAERERRQNRMAAAALYHLCNGADGDAFREHARFCLTHLPQITIRSQQISTLRRAVLNLAVRGHLVAQDPNDEPVAQLLMQNDRARQKVAHEDRRVDADRQVLLAAESKWKVPPSWGGCALADLVLFIDYRGKTPNKTDRGVRLITAKNVKKGFINISPEEFLSESDYHTWMTRGFPRVGDILFTTEAPMGNAAVVRLSERFALAQRVICFRPYGAVNPDFLALQLLAEPFLSILEKTATGLTAKGIKAAKLKRLPIAVPPLAEQLRIVARVDELMALCDKLEAQLATAQTETSRLLESVLHHALNDAVEIASPNRLGSQIDLLPARIHSQ
jgi:type I restriction enzyme S subunit